MLTSQQYLDLAAAIIADPNLVVFRTEGNDGGIVDYYNALTTTNAWSTNVSSRTLDEGADYATFDSVVAGKRDAWALFLQYAPRDLSKNKNRKTVTDVWGNATAGSAAEAILNACTRKATRAEVLFGGATASTGTVSALKLNWEGRITNDDVVRALRG